MDHATGDLKYAGARVSGLSEAEPTYRTMTFEFLNQQLVGRAYEATPAQTRKAWKYVQNAQASIFLTSFSRRNLEISGMM
jgi:hypothetical protein